MAGFWAKARRRTLPAYKDLLLGKKREDKEPNAKGSQEKRPLVPFPEGRSVGKGGGRASTQIKTTEKRKGHDKRTVNGNLCNIPKKSRRLPD